MALLASILLAILANCADLVCCLSLEDVRGVSPLASAGNTASTRRLVRRVLSNYDPAAANIDAPSSEPKDSLLTPQVVALVREGLCEFNKTDRSRKIDGYFGRKAPALYHEVMRSSVANGDIYTFGVFNGDTMRHWHQYMPLNRQWGFDSFQGLPPESPLIDRKEYVNYWKVGAMKSALQTSKQRADFVNRIGGDSLASLIPGFFNESLTTALINERGMRPAAVIDIDSDLYISAYQALDWAFSHGLVKRGTIIVYDEFTAEGREGVIPRPCLGECKVHFELAEKYGVQFTQVSGDEFEEPGRKDHDCTIRKLTGLVRAFVVDRIGQT